MYCIPVIIVSLAHLGVNNLLLMQATLLKIWLGLWFLTPLSTYFSCGQFYWWRKPEYPKKTTDLPQVTDNLYRLKLHRIYLAICGISTHNLIGHMY